MKLHYVTFAIVLSGGSTASSMTDIENFGKFSNLKGTPTIGRKMFSLKVREGKKEVKKIDQRRKFHKQKVNSCSFVVVKVLVKVNY